jgi:GT2 family glycosyltransferase
MASVDLTAIVIAHDVRDEVLACLESLERHHGDLRLQIVVVDNGSRDGTADAVASRHPDVEVVRLERNAGMPARNEGLRRARGRHRMFIDSDASVTAGALETLVAVLDGDPSLGLVGPRLVYRDGRRQLSTRRYPPLLLPILRRPPLGRFFEHRATIRRHLMADEPGDRQRRVEYVLGACQVFRAEAQAAAGEIDRHIWYGHDDADWCFAIRRAGFAIGYAPDADVVHDYRRSSARSPVSMLALRQLWAHMYFQAKWWRHRARLRAEGRAMDAEARDSALAERLPTTV